MLPGSWHPLIRITRGGKGKVTLMQFWLFCKSQLRRPSAFALSPFRKITGSWRGRGCPPRRLKPNLICCQNFGETGACRRRSARSLVALSLPGWPAGQSVGRGASGRKTRSCPYFWPCPIAIAATGCLIHHQILF